jgi:hypothetical protein
MQILDYDVTFAITGDWYGEVYDCATKKVVYVTPRQTTQAAAIQAAEAFIEAQDTQEEVPA